MLLLKDVAVLVPRHMLESAFAGAEKLKVDRVTITESVSMIMVIYNTWEFLHTATGLGLWILSIVSPVAFFNILISFMPYLVRCG